MTIINSFVNTIMILTSIRSEQTCGAAAMKALEKTREHEPPGRTRSSRLDWVRTNRQGSKNIQSVSEKPRGRLGEEETAGGPSWRSEPSNLIQFFAESMMV